MAASEEDRMSKSFVVEIWGDPAGIVLQKGLSLRFLSNAVLTPRVDGSCAGSKRERFSVEISGETVGVVRRDTGSLRFHATSPELAELDGAYVIPTNIARMAAAQLHLRDGATIRFR
jgi:hypothetical protein